MRSLAGNCSLITATSGAGLSIDATRQGIRRIGISPTAATTLASTVRSESARAQQSRASPRLASSADKRTRLMRILDMFARQDACLAAAASAVLAAVGQDHALSQRRF